MKNAKSLKWLLCLCCLLTTLFTLALATNAEIVSSGYCGAEGAGKNLEWTLDRDGTLIISGSGQMKDYSVKYSHTIAPWETKCQKVIIKHGVKSIGENAFYGCNDLISASIASSVIETGKNAFYKCEKLSSVTIENGVKKIGENAFYGCKSLTEIIIPKSVTSIEGGTFMYCSNLSTISLPDGLTSIGGGAFMECRKLNAVNIPDSVTYIGSSAFNLCCSLKSITIPNGVSRINNMTFWECGGIKSIIIPDGVKSIGYQAFYHCSKLTAVTIPISVTEIDETAFDGIKPTVYGYSGSYAEIYAKYNSFPFVRLYCEEEHIWDNGEITSPATCTTNGIKTYTCTICKETKTEMVKSTGHKPVIDAAIAPTCISDGKTEGSHCSVCGNVLQKQFDIKATGHQWDDGKTVLFATCTENGAKVYVCKTCNERKTEVINATGHQIQKDEAVKATCTTDGKTVGTHCALCGIVLQAQETIKALGHQWNEGSITSEATCIKEGTKTCTCTVCGAKKTESIERLPHTWNEGKVIIKASCEENGELVYTCTVCGAAVTVPGDAALGHAWGAWTNLNGTSHKRVCANDPTHVETAEHVWDDGTVTTEPTDKAEGVKTYTCTVCGAEKTEPVPMPEPVAKQAPGDVDGDGKVTSADARLALRASVGLKEKDDVTEGSAGYLACDVDGDGKVTSGDARLILRASVGLETLT